MFSCIDRCLSKGFYQLGSCIGRWPGYFIVIPFFLSLLLVTGIQRMKYEDDPEYLFSPSNGRSKHERSVIDNLFPMNYTRNFDAGRLTHKGRFGRLILTASDNQSVLRPEIFRIAVQVDRAIRQMQIVWDEDEYTYQQLCAKMGDYPQPPTPAPEESSDEEEIEPDTRSSPVASATETSEEAAVTEPTNSTDNLEQPSELSASAQTQVSRVSARCFRNDVLDFSSQIENLAKGRFQPTYPAWFNEVTLKAYYFPSSLGGVTVDRNSTLKTAEALSLQYFLDISVKHGDMRAAIWEQDFLRLVQQLQQQYPQVRIARYVSTTLKEELERNTHSLVPFFSVTVLVMIVFSVATCTMADWVRSKPWLGLLGCVSAGLAVAASFGVCMYANVPMIGINLAAPFLMLGVGMDDAFVLLAAWRRTSPTAPVQQRLAETYSEAAVSITITSITNFISFLIGTITPFPSVRIFCIYTAVAVLFTYFFHIVFFGGWMAVFGHIERKNLHSLICVPVIPKSLADGKGCCFKLLCTGGINLHDPGNKRDNKEHALMIFFRDYLAIALNRTWVKILVLFGFMIYLLIGIYGCSMIKEGLDRRKLSRDDSYSVEFYDLEDRDFREYPHRIQVIFNETLDYSDTQVQQTVEQILQRFENSKYIGSSNLSESWLRSYLRFLKRDETSYFLTDYNVSTSDGFYAALREVFLQFPIFTHLRADIRWSEDGRQIISSRHVIQSRNIPDANGEKDMLIDLRHIADSSPLKVTIYHHLFIFFDQFILVREISLQTIAMAALVMMGISLLFIPSFACAFWVAFSIISIEVGVIGYMTLWSVNLDTISMINLIMCIGFSVDFSAHISYAYISSDLDTAAERVQAALYSLGVPILQGSVSTILGIIALAFAPSYIFLTFFKTVFLVMLFGALHGILLLPVLLSLSDGCFGRKRKPIPIPLHFADQFENQFSMGIGPPFSKYPPGYPPLAMSGPAFGPIPLPAGASFGFPVNAKQRSKMDSQAVSDTARLALYRSQFAFLPVGFDAAPYAIGPAFAYHPHLNPLGTDGFGKSDHDKQQQFAKQSKLIPSNESSESCSSNSHDIGLGTSGEDCSEGSWNAAQTSSRPIQSESEMNRSKDTNHKKVVEDCKTSGCTCAEIHETRSKNVLHPAATIKNKPKQNNGHFNYAYVEENDDEDIKHLQHFESRHHQPKHLKQSRKAAKKSKAEQMFETNAAIAAHSQFWFQNRPLHQLHQMTRGQFHARSQQPPALSSPLEANQTKSSNKRIFY